MLGQVRAQVQGVVFGLAMLGVLVAGAPVQAGILEPELSITGGTGVPGGTVAVTLALADDDADEAYSAGIDLRFPADQLEFPGSVGANCTVAERIAETHEVAGRVLPSGAVNIEVLIAGAPEPPLPPLGNGDLVSCDFRIRDGVAAGTAALEIEEPLLGDVDGLPIPVVVRNGFVLIVDALPTSTPTVTSTPEATSTPTPSATATGTGEPTNTSTPTVTPPTEATATATATGSISVPTATNTVSVPTATATRTGGTPTATRTGGTPTATRRPGNNDDSCAIIPPAQSSNTGTAALLGFAAVLVWLRRRN